MKYPNSVLDQRTPWHMEFQHERSHLNGLDRCVRKHVEDVVDKGYTVIKNSMPKEFCKDLISEFKRFAELNVDKFSRYLDRDGHYPRIINLHAVLPDLFKLFSENRITLQVQEVLFRAQPSLYTSLFYERGSGQPLHRDTPVFSTKPEYFYFGVWVALEDANEVNGALEVMEGGHKMPELDRPALAREFFSTPAEISDFSQPLWDRYQAAVLKQCSDAGLTKKMLQVEAGDTVIWHPQLPHGGGPIQDIRRSRFSFVMHTTPLGVPVYHQPAFFDPTRELEKNANWNYVEAGGHYYANHLKVDFDHKEQYYADEFKLLSKHSGKHAVAA